MTTATCQWSWLGRLDGEHVAAHCVRPAPCPVHQPAHECLLVGSTGDWCCLGCGARYVAQDPPAPVNDDPFDALRALVAAVEDMPTPPGRWRVLRITLQHARRIVAAAEAS